MLRTPIQLGTTVYGSDGQKIGDVAEIQPRRFVIEKGFIFTKDLYIPMSTIDGEHEDGVRLNMTKAEVENTDWSNPPAVSQGDQPGTTVTDRDVQHGQHDGPVDVTNEPKSR